MSLNVSKIDFHNNTLENKSHSASVDAAHFQRVELEN